MKGLRKLAATATLALHLSCATSSPVASTPVSNATLSVPANKLAPFYHAHLASKPEDLPAVIDPHIEAVLGAPLPPRGKVVFTSHPGVIVDNCAKTREGCLGAEGMFIKVPTTPSALVDILNPDSVFGQLDWVAAYVHHRIRTATVGGASFGAFSELRAELLTLTFIKQFTTNSSHNFGVALLQGFLSHLEAEARFIDHPPKASTFDDLKKYAESFGDHKLGLVLFGLLLPEFNFSADSLTSFLIDSSDGLLISAINKNIKNNPVDGIERFIESLSRNITGVYVCEDPQEISYACSVRSSSSEPVRIKLVRDESSFSPSYSQRYSRDLRPQDLDFIVDMVRQTPDELERKIRSSAFTKRIKSIARDSPGAGCSEGVYTYLRNNDLFVVSTILGGICPVDNKAPGNIAIYHRVRDGRSLDVFLYGYSRFPVTFRPNLPLPQGTVTEMEDSETTWRGFSTDNLPSHLDARHCILSAVNSRFMDSLTAMAKFIVNQVDPQ
ncbi:hypothetical protein HZC07_02745 [Candidatus Micrarchaeota archaeon]|nr:hypothetical protein [Candidatus Micrarchaeota archaeon]